MLPKLIVEAMRGRRKEAFVRGIVWQDGVCMMHSIYMVPSPVPAGLPTWSRS